jgi:hypothetical protein
MNTSLFASHEQRERHIKALYDSVVYACLYHPNSDESDMYRIVHTPTIVLYFNLNDHWVSVGSAMFGDELFAAGPSNHLLDCIFFCSDSTRWMEEIYSLVEDAAKAMGKRLRPKSAPASVRDNDELLEAIVARDVEENAAKTVVPITVTIPFTEL